jgi:hypothetical protein
MKHARFSVDEPPDRNHVYLSHWDNPPPAILDGLRGFGARYHQIERWWTIAATAWPDLKAWLEAWGVDLVADQFVKTFDRARPDAPPTNVVDRTATSDDGPEAGFARYCVENFIIKNKTNNRYEPFRLNPVQRRLYEIMNRQYAETGRVRVIVLKARQEGVSTVVQAFMFKLVLENAGYDCLVMAHDEGGTDAVFRRTKIFRDECPFKRPEKYSNRKEIEYEAPHRSAMRCHCAGSSAGSYGRADTRQAAHLSELAFWPEVSAHETCNGVLNSIHDVDGTVVVIESTANGMGGPFYQRWHDAVLKRSDYVPVFFSWLEDETYRNDTALDDLRFANVPKEWLDDEPMLRKMGADDQQIAWRRIHIGSKCGGSLDTFKTEYPAFPAEAFIQTGRAVFPRSTCVEQRDLALSREEKMPGSRFEIDGRGKFVRERHGRLRMWRPPEPDRHYLVTADLARGVQVEQGDGVNARLGDYTTAGVYDRETWEEVAIWHGREDPDLFAKTLARIGLFYNKALMVPEANHYGVICVKALVRERYPNIYRKKRHDKPTGLPIPQSTDNYMEMGWWTTVATKPVMVADLNQCIRERLMVIHEPEAWDEILTYIRKQDGKLEAANGCYDDRVMRLGIAATILKTEPLPKAKTSSTMPAYSYGWVLEKVQERQRSKREHGKEPSYT